ncbi:MAG TPA: hypothetical protein VLE53_15255 [Gemmatimonadaceae bacterium]|nr:hypothetical protein [Gemmatimonadaceae bacterium]
MSRVRIVLSASVLAGAAWTAPLGAQGSVSTQGFGYPAGGLSTRAAASGGAFAEFDFATPRNPSSLLGWGRGGGYLQYDPEFRSVTAAAGSENALIARFPVAIAAVQLGPRAMAAVSFSTLLDRTWATRVRGAQILGPDSVGYLESVESTGAISDLRLALAYSVSEAFSVGLGVHGLTGENRMELVRIFDDSLKYGALVRRLTLSYLGNAVSLGATWRPSRYLAVAASTRLGGDLDLRIDDAVAARATTPGRIGFSVRYDGLPGASVAFTADQTSWSNMRGLSENTLVAHDVWEYGVGMELSGPPLRGVPALFSLGYRQRDLPFSVGVGEVPERFLAAGLGIPLAGPRAIVDIGVQRASRGTVDGVRETALILSFGLTIRP